MNDACHLDFETCSTVDLKAAGSYKYVLDETTRVLCAAYRLPGDPHVSSWIPERDGPPPAHLVQWVAGGGIVRAHNALFERLVWNMVLRRMFPGLPIMRIAQMDCTMVRCLVAGWPASLDQAASAMGLPVRKSWAGYQLMLRMCKPRRPRKGEDPNAIIWDHHTPGNLLALSDYCVQDVATEEAIDAAVPHLTAEQRREWILDQEINDRGIQIDIRTVHRALPVIDELVRRANVRMWQATEGAVEAVTQTARIVKWLNANGVECVSVRKEDVEDLIFQAGNIDRPDIMEALSIREEYGKSSVGKYEKMKQITAPDGRARGLVQYNGATTGRWAGRHVQPQNLPRMDGNSLARTLRMVRLLADQRSDVPDIADAFDAIFDVSPARVLKESIRALIVAPAGMKLVGGDFANIEGRVNAWLSGEAWKVKAFADFDLGQGDDLYKLAYARAFGIPVSEVTKEQRQIGKVMELALGYQGGVGAFQTMASSYGLSVTDERADELKAAWRGAHPRIVQGWWDLKDAAMEAVRCPGVMAGVFGGRIRYYCDGRHLYCALPSGRFMTYPDALIEPSETPVGVRDTVTYWAYDGSKKKWAKERLYGGLQCENVVQAIARDILSASIFNAEAAGFRVVLHVHDELLTEATPDRTADQLGDAMRLVPTWAAGLPIAASTWEDQRYVK